MLGCVDLPGQVFCRSYCQWNRTTSVARSFELGYSHRVTLMRRELGQRTYPTIVCDTCNVGCHLFSAVASEGFPLLCIFTAHTWLQHVPVGMDESPLVDRHDQVSHHCWTCVATSAPRLVFVERWGMFSRFFRFFEGFVLPEGRYRRFRCHRHPSACSTINTRWR